MLHSVVGSVTHPGDHNMDTDPSEQPLTGRRLPFGLAILAFIITPCPLDPWTLSCLRSPGRLGLLDACFLNSLGLTAWDCPSQKATPSLQCPSPMHLPQQRGHEHDFLLGGRASPETQGGRGPPCQLQLTLSNSHGSGPRARPALQTPTKHCGGQGEVDITSSNTYWSQSSHLQRTRSKRWVL